MRHCIILGLIILLSGCASTKNYYSQTVSSWRGGNAHNLTKVWGSPDQLVVGQNGNAYLIYKTSSYRAGFASAAPNVGINVAQPNNHPVLVNHSSTIGTGSRTLSLNCVSIFEINQKRTIVNTQYMGNGCYGSQNFAERMSNNQ